MASAPDYMEPMLAYRVWGLTAMVNERNYTMGHGTNPILVSPVRRNPWPARDRFKATCLNMPMGSLMPIEGGVPHTIPPSCETCGVYGVTEIVKCLEYVEQNCFLGVGAFWGKTVAGPRGYRAQYCYPRALISVPDFNAADEISELVYGTRECTDFWHTSQQQRSSLSKGHYEYLQQLLGPPSKISVSVSATYSVPVLPWEIWHRLTRTAYMRRAMFDPKYFCYLVDRLSSGQIILQDAYSLIVRQLPRLKVLSYIEPYLESPDERLPLSTPPDYDLFPAREWGPKIS